MCIHTCVHNCSLDVTSVLRELIAAMQVLVIKLDAESILKIVQKQDKRGLRLWDAMNHGALSELRYKIMEQVSSSSICPFHWDRKCYCLFSKTCSPTSALVQKFHRMSRLSGSHKHEYALSIVYKIYDNINTQKFILYQYIFEEFLITSFPKSVYVYWINIVKCYLVHRYTDTHIHIYMCFFSFIQ